MLLGDRYDISVKRPMPVIDISQSTKLTDVSSETVSFADGAAGKTQKLKLSYDNVLSEYGNVVGDFGDTSLAWTTGTVLTTEVAWKYKNIAGKDNDTARLASLANGEFMVDYENGYILGKNAITTSSASDVVDYKVKRQEINATINVSSIQIGDVELLGNTSAAGTGTTYHALIDTAGHLQIDIVSIPAVDCNGSNVTVDNAADAGVYVREGTSASWNIRALTNADVITVEQTTAASLKATVYGAGTAGSADAGVVSIQGIASMTAVVVDGSGVTQPVSVAATVEVVGDAASNAAAAGNPVLMGGLYVSTKPTILGTGDVGTVLVDSYGRLLPGIEPEAFQATITTANASSAVQVKAKTASKKMYITRIIYSTDTAISIQFQDDTATPVVLIEQNYHAANSGAVLTFDPSAPLIVDTNKDLDVLASGAGNISVTVTGYLNT